MKANHLSSRKNLKKNSNFARRTKIFMQKQRLASKTHKNTTKSSSILCNEKIINKPQIIKKSATSEIRTCDLEIKRLTR